MKKYISPHTPKPTDIYVSPAGRDENPGTLELPLVSLTAAKQLANDRADESLTVWLREGRYCLDTTLTFDGGDRQNRVYASYPGEKAIISGGRALSSWKPTTYKGIDIWETGLDLGGENLSFLSGADTSRPISRYPLKGNFKVASADGADALFTEENTPWLFTRGHLSFTAKTADLDGIDGIVGSRVRILHYWKDENMPVTGYDPASGKLSLGRPCAMTVNAGDKYFLENIPAGLAEPGSWYHDGAAKKLYYAPLPGETIENTVLYAGVLARLISFNGAGGLTFDRLTLADSAELLTIDTSNIPHGINAMEFPQAAVEIAPAVELENSENINFTGCVFRDLGGTAITVGQNVNNVTVQCSEILNVGANGIHISGSPYPAVGLSDAELVPKNIKIHDNLICGYGRRSFGAIGVLLRYANQCEISANEICQGYYTGISVGWVWGYADSPTNRILVSDNYIHHIGQSWLSDMGGIYTLGRQPGSVFSGNVIHDVSANEEEGGYGGWGLYFDEGSSYILAKNNLVYNCNYDAVHQHYGLENRLTNNILYGGKEGTIRISRREDHVSLIIDGNLILTDSDRFFCDYNAHAEVNNNIFWKYRADIPRDEVDSPYFRGAVLNDPGIPGIANLDFSIPDTGEVSKIGFTPWDYGSAGRKTEL